MTDARPTCRHCLIRVVSKPRGLCYACHRNLSVRECYPTTSAYANRGVDHGERASVPPGAACRHPQGSPGRMDTLSRRAEALESLWHPGDCREITDDADNRARHAA